MAAPAMRYDPDERLRTFLRFIEAVEDGESVRTAVALANTSWRAVALWMADDRNTLPDDETGRAITFGARYARARHMSATMYEDKAQEAVESATAETWQIAKLKADQYKWHAKVRNPKQYGDRVEHEHSGTVGHLHLDALRLAQSTQRNVNHANTLTRLPDPTVNATPIPIEASGPESLPTTREAPPSLSAGTGLVEGGTSVSALTPQSASSASASVVPMKLPWSATAAERAEWARIHGSPERCGIGSVEPPSGSGEGEG